MTDDVWIHDQGLPESEGGPGLLGVDVDEALPVLRAHAESLMRDSCVIERRGEPVRDEVTLETREDWQVVYSGPCRVKAGGSQPSTDAVAGGLVTVADAVVKLPVGPERFADDDRVTVTGSAYDPALVGAVFTVLARETVTTATSRRLHVSEVTTR